jgi:hypothetical protein
LVSRLRDLTAAPEQAAVVEAAVEAGGAEVSSRVALGADGRRLWLAHLKSHVSELAPVEVNGVPVVVPGTGAGADAAFVEEDIDLWSSPGSPVEPKLGEGASPEAAPAYAAWTVKMLQQELKARGAKVSGADTDVPN